MGVRTMVRLVPQSHSSALDSVPLHSGKRDGRQTQEDPATTVLVVISEPVRYARIMYCHDMRLCTVCRKIADVKVGDHRRQATFFGSSP
jgi:hypothetical protein